MSSRGSLPPGNKIKSITEQARLIWYPAPSELDWDRVERFLGFVWKLCLTHRGSVTGGCRTVKRNSEVGGHDESRHLFGAGWGCAVDIMFDSRTGREQACDVIMREGYRYYIGSDYAPEQLHVQMVGVGEPLSAPL